VLGVPSGLQAGDHLVAIEGISLDQKFLSGVLFRLQPSWQAGKTVQYTVQRAGQDVDLQVPLVRWDITLFQRVIGSPRDLIYSLSYLLLLGTGLVAFLKRPDIPAARAILLLGAGWMSMHLTMDLVPLTVHDDIFPFAAYGGQFLIGAAFTILIPPAFIRFALVFPHPKPMLERRPWLAFLPFLVGIGVIVAFLSGAFVFGFLWTGFSVILSIGILIHNAFTMRDAVSQAQLRWGLGGMILGLGIFLTAFFPLFVSFSPAVENFMNTISPLGFGVIGVTLGVAVLRYRLFDIDFFIRRTLQYTLLTGLLALIYFGGVLLFQEIFGRLTGERNSSLVTVLSTLAIAFLFNPLRIRVQRLIDRQFYRSKYQAEQTLAAFSAMVRDEVNMDRLTNDLLDVVEETVQPTYAILWLREDK